MRDVCVYALTAAPAAHVRSRGLGGEALRAVTVGRVSAIVGELPNAPKPTRDELTRYDAVIHRLALKHAALIPARFGTCFARPDELTFILESRQASFRRALRHVRGRVQMTVRVLGIETSESAVAAPRSRSADADASGRAYLRERAADAARLREIVGFDPVRAAVRRWVRDERVEKRDRIATVYHLIPRGAAAAYARTVRAAAERGGLRVAVSGPFPPYAFAGW